MSNDNGESSTAETERDPSPSLAELAQRLRDINGEGDKIRTSVYLESTLVAQAKALGINISEVARDSLARRVAEVTRPHDEAADSDGMLLIHTWKDKEPVAFWGKHLAHHYEYDFTVYLTKRDSIVTVEEEMDTSGHIDRARIVSVEPVEQYLAALRPAADGKAAGPYDYDEEFIKEVYQALGRMYYRLLDI